MSKRTKGEPKRRKRETTEPPKVRRGFGTWRTIGELVDEVHADLSKSRPADGEGA